MRIRAKISAAFVVRRASNMYAAATPPFRESKSAIDWFHGGAWAPFSSLLFPPSSGLEPGPTSVLGAEISALDLSLLSVGGNVFYYCHFWALINPRFCRV